MAADIGLLNAESGGSCNCLHAPGCCDFIGCEILAEGGAAALVAIGDDDDVDCGSLGSDV